MGVRRKWRLIGNELGLSIADLDTVQADYTDTVLVINPLLKWYALG